MQSSIATRNQAMGKSRDIGIARSHRIHDLAGLDYAAFMEALAIEGNTALLSQGRNGDARAKALNLLEPCPKVGGIFLKRHEGVVDKGKEFLALVLGILAEYGEIHNNGLARAMPRRKAAQAVSKQISMDQVMPEHELLIFSGEREILHDTIDCFQVNAVASIFKRHEHHAGITRLDAQMGYIQSLGSERLAHLLTIAIIADNGNDGNGNSHPRQMNAPIDFITGWDKKHRGLGIRRRSKIQPRKHGQPY